MSKILAKNFEWETYDGETEGYLDEYEVSISARPTAKDIRWGEQDTNVRTWTLAGLGSQGYIASGKADGVRACKKAALAALNAHLTKEA